MLPVQKTLLAEMAEPENCEACAATCPLLKKQGCAFDAAMELVRLQDALEGMDVDLVGVDDALAELQEKAKTCRVGIIQDVRRENELNAVADRVMARLPAQVLLQAGMAKAAAELQARAGKAKPRAVVADDDAGEPEPVSVAAAPQPPLQALAAPTQPRVQPAAKAPAAKKKARGDSALYVDPNHEAIEDRLDATAGVHCYTYPKVKASGCQDYIDQVLKPKFEAAGLEFLVAVPKRYNEDSEFYRVGVWYRGPPWKEANKMLAGSKEQAPAEQAQEEVLLEQPIVAE